MRWALAAGVFGLALWVRLRDLDAGVMLIDALGPYLTAYGSPLNPHPHAPPYGPGLYPPYALALHAGTLRGAAAVVLGVHALVAPVGVLAAWSLGGRVAAVAVGLLLAVDPGLLDTARSGSEAYFGALWIGLGGWGLTQRRAAACAVGGAALAIAVMNHPLALAAAPLLALVPRCRAGAAGVVAFAVLVAPHLLGLVGSSSGTGSDLGPPAEALPAYLSQGGPAAWAVLGGPLVGLCSARTRPLAAATLVGAVVIGTAGAHLGYLRDHHLRLLTVPALVGWAALRGPLGWLPLLLLRPAEAQAPPDGHPPRPGTVGLAHVLSESLPEGPFWVEGAVLAGTPAAEPAALMLDQVLRGRPVDEVDPTGQLVWLVTHPRGRGPAAELTLHAGDRHLLGVLDATEICSTARIGGARDALAVLRPELPGADACLSIP